MAMSVSVGEIYASYLFGDGFIVFGFKAVGKDAIKLCQ